MKRGQLLDFFIGAAAKRLSAVDAEPKRSNQHEIGTTREIRERLLGEIHNERLRVVYAWLGSEEDACRVNGNATHYDARANNANRAPEWRLYYSSNAVTELMGEGDSLFLAMDREHTLYFIVAPHDSSGARQLSWLFDLTPSGSKFVSREFREDAPELDFAERFVLEQIGVEADELDVTELDKIVEPYGTTFPGTAEFSNHARSTLPHIRPDDDPDSALLAWHVREEAMFRRLENRIVSVRLTDGFVDDDGADVDGFISYALSVLNRRKARMGKSLENHIEAILKAFGIPYVRDAVIEKTHRPDFLFPSLEVYKYAPATGAPYLAMLGAKSSCKERWRQVLSEADKVPRKHLLTLEHGISEKQTEEMEHANLQLVVPKGIQRSYTPEQQSWLWSVDDFVRDVSDRCRV